MTKLVILFTCFNRVETTQSFVENLIQLQNKQHNIDILVVDGGSSDGTIEMLSSFENVNFQLLQTPSNFYWSESMKLGFRVLEQLEDWTGIICCNDDADLDLSIVNEFLESAYQEDVLIGKFCEPGTSKKSYGGLKKKKFFPYSFETGDSAEYDSFNTNFVYFKRSVIEQCGWFNDGFRHGKSDIFIGARLKQMGYSLKEFPYFVGECTRGGDRFLQSFNKTRNVVDFLSLFLSPKWHPFNERCEFCAFFVRLRFLECVLAPYLLGILKWCKIKLR